MHKKGLILTLLSTIAVSCGSNNLPSEISDFINGFSYQKARDSVLKGHYIDSSVGKYQGKDCLFYDEVSFDISKENEVSFYHYYKSVNYGTILDEEYTVKITTEEGKYIHDNNGVKSEISYSAAKEETYRFFYSSYYPNTDHHYGGMYYGDMIKSEAYKQQSFVTISEDKTTYTYKVDGFKDSSGVVTKINYSVNRLGMLISLSDSGYKDGDSSTYFDETITVTY